MKYSIEELYKLIGRDDKVAVIEFIEESDNYKEFGKSITVMLIYNQFEREKLERAFLEGTLKQSHGKVQVKLLIGNELTDQQKGKLKKEGINSEDIEGVFSGWVHENLFHEEKTRQIETLEIPFHKEPKGGDYDWIYGFKKKLLRDGVGFHPYERDFYLAMKKFFEPKKITAEELAEIEPNGVIRPEIELKYLEIKLECEVINPEEETKYTSLLRDSAVQNFEILKREINSAGLSLKKLNQENPRLLKFLIAGVIKFIPERLNVSGKKAIYLDWKGFLHVFLRHVKEFEIGEQWQEKTKFLWTHDKITMVMKKVISSIDKDIQTFWKQNPNQRFSKYGQESLYFEGDYYTFHIESDGRLSTFHAAKKRI